MRDIPTTFDYGLGKIGVITSIYHILPLIIFFSSAHSLIAGKCLCRVRDMMPSNDGKSRLCTISSIPQNLHLT